MTAAEGLDAYRNSFAEDPLFLNFASYGPPSTDVVMHTAALLELAAAGKQDVSETLFLEEARAREAISRLCGFPLERVALTGSTSLGLFQAAMGIDRGVVLVGAGEFPANHYPWYRSAQLGRAIPKFIGSMLQPVTADLIAREFTTDTVAVSVSAVDFRTGYRTDLGAIREVIGDDRLLIVDGIQGFGVIDAEWTAADVLVVGGQKWLRAGWGTGFLAFSERGLDGIEPALGGWTGVTDPSIYDGMEHAAAPDARRFSITNLSPISSGAFATALELVETATTATIGRAVEASHKILVGRLMAVGATIHSPEDPDQRAGIVVFSVAEVAGAEVHEALRRARITSTFHGPGRLRLSVHATTRIETLELVGEVVRQLR